MAAVADLPAKAIHPLHAVLLAATLPLFLGGLLSDLAYSSTFEIQWVNFAAWLVAGGMVFTGFALVWALVDIIRNDRRRRRSLVYFGLLLAVFVLGLLNSLVHARDAWATMPAGLILSVVVTLLAVVATAVGFSSLRAGGVK